SRTRTAHRRASGRDFIWAGMEVMMMKELMSGHIYKDRFSQHQMKKTLLKALLSAMLLFGFSTNATTQKSEQEIADWVIRQGGRAILESGREQGKPIGDIARLPADEVHIIGIDLVGTLIEPKDLEKLSGLSGLKELYLPGPSWNPGAGSRLDANEELKFLAGL